MNQPVDAAQAQAELQTAIGLHQAGRSEQAEAAYRRILSDDPKNPDALHLLGLLAAQSENLPVAVDLIGRAILINPDVPSYYLNLGNVLRLLGRQEEAAACYERALDLSPDMPEVLSNLGTMYQQQKRFEEAEQSYRRALAVSPDFGNALYNLGIVLRRLGRRQESAEAFRRLLKVQPNFGAAYENLARTLYRDGRFDEAAQVYAEWLRIEPDNPMAKHMHAAMTGRDVEGRAPDGYIRTVFDQFASDFDEVLRKLNYQAPSLIEGAVARWRRDRNRPPVDIVDAGCGTGLCGVLLKPHARRLIGVDLSAGMLAKAGDLGVYDALIEAELGAFFAERRAPVDLIVSGDTLVYFGAIDELMAGMATALNPGGAIIATFESLSDSDGGTPFRLQGHGRYSHHPAYLRNAVEAAGMTLDACEAVVLRQEAGQPVAGLMVTAAKPRGAL